MSKEGWCQGGRSFQSEAGIMEGGVIESGVKVRGWGSKLVVSRRAVAKWRVVSNRAVLGRRVV